MLFNQSRRPARPLAAHSRNSATTALVMKKNMYVVKTSVIIKPNNKYFISTSCNADVSCLVIIAA
jgi:hypothetical protein